MILHLFLGKSGVIEVTVEKMALLELVVHGSSCNLLLDKSKSKFGEELFSQYLNSSAYISDSRLFFSLWAGVKLFEMFVFGIVVKSHILLL